MSCQSRQNNKTVVPDPNKPTYLVHNYPKFIAVSGSPSSLFKLRSQSATKPHMY